MYLYSIHPIKKHLALVIKLRKIINKGFCVSILLFQNFSSRNVFYVHYSYYLFRISLWLFFVFFVHNSLFYTVLPDALGGTMQSYFSLLPVASQALPVRGNKERLIGRRVEEETSSLLTFCTCQDQHNSVVLHLGEALDSNFQPPKPPIKSPCELLPLKYSI